MAAEPATGGHALLRMDAQGYGPEYRAHLLEQYKLYVESAQKVSERRISASNYLLTINSSLITLYGISAALEKTQRWNMVIPFAGILVCITWFHLVESYKNLNSAKFAVIHALEDHLPAAVFDYEWTICEAGRGRSYRPLSHLERWIPIIFGVFYLALAIITVSVPLPAPKANAVSMSGTVDVRLLPESQEHLPEPSRGSGPATPTTPRR